MIVGIQQMCTLVTMAGQVNLAHAIDRNSFQKGLRRESVVVGADEHIVDVEQDATVGSPTELGQELPLGQSRMNRRCCDELESCLVYEAKPRSVTQVGCRSHDFLFASWENSNSRLIVSTLTASKVRFSVSGEIPAT